MARSRSYQYDICLSFAGEDRRYVRRLAKLLTNKGIRVFYDEYEKAELWGKDLYSHLDDIYQNAARYCAVFISKNYARKLWTNHERRSAQARAFRTHAEYVLPIRLDGTKVEGVRDTVGHVDLKNTTMSELCDLIVKKVGPHQRKSYLPPVPDRLFKRLKIKTSEGRLGLEFIARSFFETLERMDKFERDIVFHIFLHGCPEELPGNIHISVDLLRRLLKTNPNKILRSVSRLKSLGFSNKVRERHGDGEFDPTLAIEWHDMHVDQSGNFTFVANEMIELARDGYCSEHGLQKLHNLDFGQLATATEMKDLH